MVKKIFSVLALACVAMAAQAQYQITNGDFETWTYDGDNLPNNWNSFQTADGGYASWGYSSSNRQVKKSTDVRPGTNGSYSCAIWARSVIGIIAQGNITTGRVHAGSTSAANKDNYNYSDRDGSNTKSGVTNPCAMKFSGHPDAVSVWVKFVPAGTVSDYPNAKFSCVVHDDNDYISYGLPENDNDTNKGYVVASVSKEFPSCDWTNYVLNFTYNSSNDDSKYIQFNASTNAYPGKGTKNDYLYVDDITLIYNSELSDATYDGLSVSFTDGSANVNALYDESKLALTSNGHAATINKSYDATTGVLTVTVKGENISEDATNYHTYTIHFLTKASMAVTSAKYGTFCAPFDVAIPSGVKAYTVEGVSSDYVLNLSEVTGTIPAGTAVVLSSDNVVSSDVTGFNNSSAKSCTTGLLTGVYSAITVPAFDASRNNNYILQSQDGKVGFYQIDEDGHAVAANRCYLSLPESASPAKVYYFNVIDGISSVEADKAENNVTYDLAGRRVSNATKGVYIINGKKVLK